VGFRPRLMVQVLAFYADKKTGYLRAQRTSALPKLKILVADDDPLSLALLHAQLTTWGYDPVLAEDGEQARKLVRSNGFPICILDWMMPGMTGLDLCAWIKGHLDPAPHVIMLTSRSAPEDMHAGYEAGADDYMTKPLDRLDLLARLRTLASKLTREDADTEKIAQMDPVDRYRQDIDLYKPHPSQDQPHV
jgi:DNA-binding response OmpR family regulator